VFLITMVPELELFKFYTWNKGDFTRSDTRGEISASSPMAALERVMCEYGNLSRLFAADIRISESPEPVVAVFLSDDTSFLKDDMPLGTRKTRTEGLCILVGAPEGSYRVSA